MYLKKRCRDVVTSSIVIVCPALPAQCHPYTPNPCVFALPSLYSLDICALYHRLYRLRNRLRSLYNLCLHRQLSSERKINGRGFARPTKLGDSSVEAERPSTYVSSTSTATSSG